jgi:ribosomal protein S18 acetylase RimI-like enzyme
MTNPRPHLIRTPWDSRALGVETYEILELSDEALAEAEGLKGHFTVRAGPQTSRALLGAAGFFYCDTLIEPYCQAGRFLGFRDKRAALSREVPLERLLEICHGAFCGRFHRDFNIPRELADRRYDLWLKDLHAEGQALGLMYEGELAGFLAHKGPALCLHALGPRHRGRGLAKYLWTAACEPLYRGGYTELTSSVSASNPPVVNLYASLGFRFRNPVDVYHKLVR